MQHLSILCIDFEQPISNKNIVFLLLQIANGQSINYSPITFSSKYLIHSFPE